jgi:hypothetical protein
MPPAIASNMAPATGSSIAPAITITAVTTAVTTGAYRPRGSLPG